MSTILITDDNSQNMYLTRFLLEQRNHTIFEATNGQQAVDLCKQHQIDLVLMDIQMPVMDGLAATRQIKQLPDPPVVIALTAKVMPGDRQKVLDAGCDGYLEKPIEPARFADQVEIHLQQMDPNKTHTRQNPD